MVNFVMIFVRALPLLSPLCQQETMKQKTSPRRRGVWGRYGYTSGYSNYTNCIYKVLFGKSAAQLRSDFGIGKTDGLRDHFSKEELRAVQSMECLVSGLVDCGWGYDQVKDFISQNNMKRLTA